MVTLEIPCSECDNVAKTYKKVSSSVRPQALNRIKDVDVKTFIEGCLTARLFAAEPLDPFFNILDYDKNDESSAS
ncbi:serine/threonine-protein kinase WNK11 [Spatholobus suberectus]|nr:serine/threonine-protein kinase WNK11 [Spatholobus suberectus]